MKNYSIEAFQKNKDYLLCVNSSGTVINAMERKHNQCYGPSFIEIWELQDHADVIQEMWNEINLYEKTRGINRFRALLVMLNRINGMFIPYSSFDSLEEWVRTSNELSTRCLQSLIAENSDPLLIKTFQWSTLINEKISLIDVKDKPPFKYVHESLKKASKYFDIAVISEASTKSIIDEWRPHNLLQYVDVIGSQEEGSKQVCIARLIEKGYSADNVLFIGDVISDYNAVHQNHALFYPIIVHDEVSSWSIFKDYYLKKIVHNDFQQYQSALLSMFQSNFESEIISHSTKNKKLNKT